MPPTDFLAPPTSLVDIIIAMALGTVLSALTGWQYVKLGRTFTNRTNLAYTLPLITLTVVLIISVAKASLALSIGLAGALSIVRFRTPIREPEELGYLFLAIGVGLGLGAGQVVVTLGATAMILLVASARRLLWKKSARRNLYLNVEVRDAGLPGEQIFQRAVERLGAHVTEADLRRLDVAQGNVQAAFYVAFANDQSLAAAVSALQRDLPGTVTVTFIDQEHTGASW